MSVLRRVIVPALAVSVLGASAACSGPSQPAADSAQGHRAAPAVPVMMPPIVATTPIPGLPESPPPAPPPSPPAPPPKRSVQECIKLGNSANLPKAKLLGYINSIGCGGLVVVR